VLTSDWDWALGAAAEEALVAVEADKLLESDWVERGGLMSVGSDFGASLDIVTDFKTTLYH